MTTMSAPVGYGLEQLIDDTRNAILSGRNIPATVGGVRRGLQQYLNNRELREDILARIAANGYRGITMYKDPELDFVITAGRGDPGVRRPAHDHSDCWAVYGVYDGAIRFRRFRLLNEIERNTWEGPADLESIAEWVAGAGSIDNILPGGIHDLCTEDEAINVIIRCHDLKTIWRNIYDLENGTFRRVRGGV